jgi:hypothetical protein
MPPNSLRSLRYRADLAWLRDELWLVWQAAHFDPVTADRAWSASPGATSYAVYRAAQDRAEQAQDDLSTPLPHATAAHR